MRKTLFLAALLIAATSLAAPVSPEKALLAAKQFLSERNIKTTLKSQPANISTRLMAPKVNPDYYIFNSNDGKKGFVIVNTDIEDKKLSNTQTSLKDGTYKDDVSGNTFTVKDGILSGTVKKNAVVVVSGQKN